MGLGAGAGAAVGGIASAADNNNGFEKIDHVATAALAVLGAGAGAITGYLIGKRGNKRVLIYESK
jgi:membrane protein DedA with SNARE-associated domain